jgi:AcrR family transcriptional regulator
MPRTRTIPDSRVFAAIEGLKAKGGTKAVSFATVAAVTGLAPPTLVQRYGSIEAMLHAARSAAWDDIGARTAAAMTLAADKGAAGFLRAIGPLDVAAIAADLSDEALSGRAASWRAGVETALAQKIGSGQKARETAAVLFAAWLGQSLWANTGTESFRMKDLVKRLG